MMAMSEPLPMIVFVTAAIVLLPLLSDGPSEPPSRRN